VLCIFTISAIVFQLFFYAFENPIPRYVLLDGNTATQVLAPSFYQQDSEYCLTGTIRSYDEQYIYFGEHTLAKIAYDKAHSTLTKASTPIGRRLYVIGTYCRSSEAPADIEISTAREVKLVPLESK
jgi:hypothetical protein